MTLKRASFLAICFSATLLAETSVPSGSGSGFFITPNGFFLTNYHVVKGAEKIQIRVGDKMLEARLIKFDRINDIAILKVDGEFASLPIGQADKVSLGDDVFTIGFPAPQLQGFAPKLTKGNISAASGLQDDPRFFQISIPIQPGNSGGPLVDEQGNAVGIVCSTLSPAIAISEGFIPQNVNFAMKTSYAVPLIGMIPDIRDKLLAPATSTTKTLSQVVAEAEKAVGLVVVYSQGVKEQHQSTVTARAGGEVADGGSAAPDTSEITRKMKRLEHRLVAAFSAQNSAEVASLLADDYTAVLANGRRVNKSAMLSLLENSADTFEYVIDDESLDVRVLSRTRAVVTGTARWKGTHKNGTSFYGALRFTSTWAERNGRWQLIVAVAADLE